MKVLAICLLLPLLWAVMASPVLLAFFLGVRLMRRKRIRSPSVIFASSLVFSLLAAPVPTPFVTLFIPTGLALISGTYFDQILHGPAMLSKLWLWIIPSLVLTFCAASAVAWRYIRSSNIVPSGHAYYEPLDSDFR